ncbi:hypothetical protein E2C01_047021 [Portunus trituberculatus]|uniref:Uncharacterized protein n=1 Tax=Portunus trituberculatus TaxID=210409 RepID=A0A5B7G6M0_PORTR|nr:hypothetical protein [Portunus trituberculatus]
MGRWAQTSPLPFFPSTTTTTTTITTFTRSSSLPRSLLLLTPQSNLFLFQILVLINFSPILDRGNDREEEGRGVLEGRGGRGWVKMAAGGELTTPTWTHNLPTCGCTCRQHPTSRPHKNWPGLLSIISRSRQMTPPAREVISSAGR